VHQGRFIGDRFHWAFGEGGSPKNILVWDLLLVTSAAGVSIELKFSLFLLAISNISPVSLNLPPIGGACV